MQSLSIIVPCFNEAKNIAYFYNAVIGKKMAEIHGKKCQNDSRQTQKSQLYRGI